MKETYTKLQQQYSLPDYEHMNRIFDIEDISKECTLPLIKIRSKIYDKIDWIAKYVENIVQPDQDLVSMYEAKYITDKMREKALQVLKELMILSRKAQVLSLDNDASKNASYIKEAFAKYIELQANIQELFDTCVSFWEKSIDNKQEVNYFG